MKGRVGVASRRSGPEEPSYHVGAWLFAS